ncbi:protein of unknown function [Arthrobacter alpinus]|uniref:Carbohydrate-binding domain-containing protein n=1 Tax=Arthrobacter alpinus TaxID=656366 RepID=A0A1H5N4K2_9MICC|nr:carbohydrate-binding domain-containing protein [Arthrobacter alpinus]SEE95831.1 protein of unknown function [Arthrobacter alpinus]
MKFFSRAQRATSVAALALALALAGCSAQSSSSTSETTSAATSSATSVVTSGTTAELAGSIAESTHFDADDLSWDAAKETTVSLADGSSAASGTNADAVSVDGNTVTITAGGTYRVSGTLGDGELVVAAGEEDVVRIILDNATVTSSSGSAVDIQSANEVLLFLDDGTTNTLSDAASYADTGTDAANAAIYSLADLTIAGTGTLGVNGNYQDGISTKDGLVLAAGNVTVKATDDGIKGKDYTVLLDGSYSVTAGGDGVKSTNDTETDRGWLLVAGGTLNVAAGDDGIKAATTLTISDGAATVSKSEEGLEAAHIAISGGTVNITSNDDGLNAAGGSTTSDAAAGDAQGAGEGAPQGGMGGGGMDTVGDFSLDISGGTVTVNAEGDGLDSNGNASISGGTVVVNGPSSDGNGALDVNGDLTVSGGTIAAAGSAGMVVTPSETSTQSGLQISFDSPVAAGTAVQITDSTGAVVATFVTAKQTSSIVFSSADIKAGEQYTVFTGGTADVEAGLATGSATGATEVTTATAGEYTTSGGPGMR